MLRFTIRDMLWLMAVVAVALGFAVYNQRPQPARLETGRFQIIDDQKNGYIYLLDTATGEMWQRYEGGWRGDRPPALKK